MRYFTKIKYMVGDVFFKINLIDRNYPHPSALINWHCPSTSKVTLNDRGKCIIEIRYEVIPYHQQSKAKLKRAQILYHILLDEDKDGLHIP